MYIYIIIYTHICIYKLVLHPPTFKTGLTPLLLIINLCAMYLITFKNQMQKCMYCGLTHYFTTLFCTNYLIIY